METDTLHVHVRVHPLCIQKFIATMANLHDLLIAHAQEHKDPALQRLAEEYRDEVMKICDELKVEGFDWQPKKTRRNFDFFSVFRACLNTKLPNISFYKRGKQ